MRSSAAIATAIAIICVAGRANAQTAAPPDQARLALAREVLQEQGGLTQYEAHIRSALSVQMRIVKDMVPADQTGSADAMFTVMAEEELKAVPAMLEDAATVYADNLSEAELRDMLAWSKSRSGRAFYAKVPMINQELMFRQVPLLKTIVGGAVQRAIEKTCTETSCTPEQRQTLTAIRDKLLKGGA